MAELNLTNTPFKHLFTEGEMSWDEYKTIANNTPTINLGDGKTTCEICGDQIFGVTSVPGMCAECSFWNS